MTEACIFRRIPHRSPTKSAATRFIFSLFHERNANYATATASMKEEEEESTRERGKWLTLPPFSSTVDANWVAKELSGRRPDKKSETTTNTTALKWVLRCCPHLPRCLVQKLFRLRQVRRGSSDSRSASHLGTQPQEHRLKRVLAKDAMNSGDRIFLPITVHELSSEKQESHCNDGEINYIQSLELYKDPAIIVVNKPPGLPVQGGTGIKRSLDALAASYLRYDYSEPPRLVLLDDGKSERITIIDDPEISSQHAVTEYQVIESCQGFTWMELCPLTGRKHQLRVHCAEVLGTPIVGDYKYGWQAHRKWKPVPWSKPERKLNEKHTDWKMLPFGLDLEAGSILEKKPHLHLHCKQMVLPNVYLALQQMQSSIDRHLSELESLNLVAPLPFHMQRSWDILRGN